MVNLDSVVFINPKQYACVGDLTVGSFNRLIFIVDDADNIQQVLYNNDKKISEMPVTQIKDVAKNYHFTDSNRDPKFEFELEITINVPNELIKNVHAPWEYDVTGKDHWITLTVFVDKYKADKIFDYMTDKLAIIFKGDCNFERAVHINKDKKEPVPDKKDIKLKEKDNKIKELENEVSNLKKTIDTLEDEKEYRCKPKFNDNGELIW